MLYRNKLSSNGDLPLLPLCECLFSVLLRTEHLESSYQARLADRMLITDRRVLFAVHNGEKYLICLDVFRMAGGCVAYQGQLQHREETQLIWCTC